MILRKSKIAFLITVCLLVCRQGFTQEYYDLYTPGELQRLKKNSFVNEELKDVHPPSGDQKTTDLPTKADKLTGYAAITNPALLPTLMLTLFVAMAIALLITIVAYTVHVFRRRRQRTLQKDFAMTSDDAELSSSALGNDPLKNLGSFDIPLPEADSRSANTSRLRPEISLTSPQGSTTNLLDNETDSQFTTVNLNSDRDKRKRIHR